LRMVTCKVNSHWKHGADFHTLSKTFVTEIATTSQSEWGRISGMK